MINEAGIRNLTLFQMKRHCMAVLCIMMRFSKKISVNQGTLNRWRWQRRFKYLCFFSRILLKPFLKNATICPLEKGSQDLLVIDTHVKRHFLSDSHYRDRPRVSITCLGLILREFLQQNFWAETWTFKNYPKSILFCCLLVKFGR